MDFFSVLGSAGLLVLCYQSFGIGIDWAIAQSIKNQNIRQK